MVKWERMLEKMINKKKGPRKTLGQALGLGGE